MFEIDILAYIVRPFHLVGDLSLSMVHAALHMVVLASRFKYTLGSSAVLDVKTVDGWKLSFQKLLAHVPKESCISRDMPVRWVVWTLEFHIAI